MVLLASCSAGEAELEPAASRVSNLEEKCEDQRTFACTGSTMRAFRGRARPSFTSGETYCGREEIGRWTCSTGCNPVGTNCNPERPAQASPPQSGGDDYTPPRHDNMDWTGAPDATYSCGEHSVILSAKAGHYVPTFCQWNGNQACAHAVRVLRSSDCTSDDATNPKICCASE